MKFALNLIIHLLKAMFCLFVMIGEITIMATYAVLNFPLSVSQLFYVLLVFALIMWQWYFIDKRILSTRTYVAYFE